jgi:hypothetical protein
MHTYILPLRFSSKCIDPNYCFYWFECFHMICPNFSPCMWGGIRIILFCTLTVFSRLLILSAWFANWKERRKIVSFVL